MKDLWSSRWLCLFLPAIVSTLGPMVLAGTVKDVLADHAIGTEAQLADFRLAREGYGTCLMLL